MSRRQIDIDKDRATVLLLINTHLIKKAYQMYVSFLSNPPALQLLAPQGRQQVLEQYLNLNRRLQCNLSVLSFINDTYHNKVAAQQPNRLQFPVILLAPLELPELRPLYKRLQDLYPEGLRFLKAKLQQVKEQGMHQGMQRPGMVQQPSQAQQGPIQGVPMPQQSPYDQFAVPTNSDMNHGRPQKSVQPQKPMDMPQNLFMGPPKDDFHGFNGAPNGQSGPGPTGPRNGGFAGGFNDNPDMGMNMLSILPQQILQQQQQQQQQNGGNDFLMDFY